MPPFHQQASRHPHPCFASHSYSATSRSLQHRQSSSSRDGWVTQETHTPLLSPSGSLSVRIDLSHPPTIVIIVAGCVPQIHARLGSIHRLPRHLLVPLYCCCIHFLSAACSVHVETVALKQVLGCLAGWLAGGDVHSIYIYHTISLSLTSPPPNPPPPSTLFVHSLIHPSLN